MRVLFLCPNVPFPAVNGGHHRSLGLIRSLARFSSVRVLAIGEPLSEGTRAAQKALAEWGATLDAFLPTGPGLPEEDPGIDRLPDAVSHFRSPALREAMKAEVGSQAFDVVHFEEVVMTQYLDLGMTRRVLDRQKVDFAYHETMADVSSSGTLQHLREAARFRFWERRLAGAFDRTMVPGASDRALLEPLHGPGSVVVVPIGIPDDLRPPEGEARGVEHVLLYGARDYGPNVEGQAWFFREVWPELKTKNPALRTVLVGSGRPPLQAEPPPSDPSVELRGFVGEIKGVLQGRGVLVVPVRVGGGARTKVLEALACGMPVVSTSMGVENLSLSPGRDFLLADTAPEMAEAITTLFRDPSLASAVGRAGASRVEEHRWGRIEKQVEEIYTDVMKTPPTSLSRPLALPAPFSPVFERDLARLRSRIEEGGGPRVSGGKRALGRALRWALRTPIGRFAGIQLARFLEGPEPLPSSGCRAKRPLARLLRSGVARLQRLMELA